MSAYANYEVHGKTRRGPVVVEVRAIRTPSPEAATWILNERYPSATFVSVTRPAAAGYPARHGVVSAGQLAATPIRRKA